MEVGIHIQCTTKTLNQCYGPGRAALERTEGKNRPLSSDLALGELCEDVLIAPLGL